MRAKYRRLRDDAYGQGLRECEALIQIPTFRDFVALYIAEGYKRCRNVVCIANSDERVVAMSASWLRRLTARKLVYSIQYHADQDLLALRRHWGHALGIDDSVIVLQRKSNSGKLNHRTWRSLYGVMSLRVSDTYLRARLEAWMYRIRNDWGLDSAPPSGA